jgi:hypothetical protein
MMGLSGTFNLPFSIVILAPPSGGVGVASAIIAPFFIWVLSKGSAIIVAQDLIRPIDKSWL